MIDASRIKTPILNGFATLEDAWSDALGVSLSIVRQKFGDGRSLGQDGNGAAGRVGEREPIRLDTEVAVEHRQDVANPYAAVGHVTALFVGGTDHLPARRAAPGKQQRGGAWPMVAP